MYSEENLSDFLDELTDDEFRKFKWHLKKETWKGITPIKQALLDKSDRLDTVDLMAQKYQLSGAATVMGIILQKMSRNDLVSKIQKLTGIAEGPVDQSPAASSDSEDWKEKLTSVRGDFVSKVSKATLDQLQDKLLEKKVLTDNEMEVGNMGKTDKARYVIDIVRNKGQKASSTMIAALCDLDSCLAEELKLK
ncbi:uncharacterized protein si:ch211-114l13.9 [Cyprinodon tularosa]|uniref:uncharacterized protein si:ch211-114l13.9 n=1 Tax=Cyprinodon tularosa TaxID=77115 RepID=UPI0018E24177|nr:uncharacterized protein si:ch211-114l13.9 [Cyprinodon tularosa]